MASNSIIQQRIAGVSPKSAPPVFARHETFHPRFGWLKKGFDKASTDPGLFLRDEASIVLGVGKNMVRAIRYWCVAFKVLEDAVEAKARLTIPTPFAQQLLGENGWDPYLEDTGSLWLLHWYLLQKPTFATTWQFVFNNFRQAEFTADDMVSALSDYVQRQYPDIAVAESSLKSDISCLLRMYSSSSQESKPNEETITCPFVELSLIEQIPSTKLYAFRVGPKHNLPAEIVTAACLQYAGEASPGLRTINLSQLLFNESSPGLCFRLTENSMCSAIESIASKNFGVSLSDTAGIVQLQFKSDPITLASKVLSSYYESGRRKK